MEFTLHGFDVYSSEVDDRGIDFVIRSERAGQQRYYDIQVKSARNAGYIFLPKETCRLRENLLIAVVLFLPGRAPDFYLIPSTVWLSPDGKVFVSRDYGEGKKSKPEWGINLSSSWTRPPWRGP